MHSGAYPGGGGLKSQNGKCILFHVLLVVIVNFFKEGFSHMKIPSKMKKFFPEGGSGLTSKSPSPEYASVCIQPQSKTCKGLAL